MNYRHAFHAGNFADVLKHVVFTLCLEHLNKKPKPYRVLDTHAGIGAYDLAGDEAARSPEWKDGIARVLEAERPADVDRILKPWLDIVRAMNSGKTLTAYPGSPEIARRMTRPDDRIQLCELHEADARTLDKRYALDSRIKVEKRDGYKAMAGVLPPKEKRGVVIVDPPFEHRDEMAHMAEAIKKSLPKWPTGTYIFWRSLKDMWASERFDNGLAEWLFDEGFATPENVLRADLWVRDLGEEGKLPGAGIVVVNPPHTLEADLLILLPWLSSLLRQGEGNGWGLDGALEEEPED